MKNLILIAAFALFVGCSTGPSIVGQPESVVFQQLGYPIQKNKLSESAHVLVYPSEPGFKRYITVRNGIVVDHYVRYEGGLF